MKPKLNQIETILLTILILFGVLLISNGIAERSASRFHTAHPNQITIIYNFQNYRIPTLTRDYFTGKLTYQEVKPYGARINWETGKIEGYAIFSEYYVTDTNFKTAKQIAQETIGR